MASWVLIEGGTVIDGTGAAPVEGCSVLLHGDRIEAVGPDAGAIRGGSCPGARR